MVNIPSCILEFTSHNKIVYNYRKSNREVTLKQPRRYRKDTEKLPHICSLFEAYPKLNQSQAAEQRLNNDTATKKG